MGIFESCVGNSKRTKFTITGHTVANYYMSPFTVWCEYFAPAEMKDPKDAYMCLLFERGFEHEKNIIEKNYKDALPITAKSFEAGFKQVIEGCEKGVKSFVHAPLFYLPEDVYGIIDILEKDTSHSSVFGDYHYIIKEIKSARNIKKEHVMQAAFYTYILGRVQKYVPKIFVLINRDGDEFRYEFDKYFDDLIAAIKSIREIQNGKVVSPTAKSCRWPWESYCNSRALDEGDVSILPSVGPAVKRKLNDAGIFTVHQLSENPLSVDIPDATLEKIKKFAQAWVQKTPVVLQRARLPKSDVDLFVDFEGTDEFEGEEGVMKVNYLIGILVSDKDGAHFRPFVAKDLSDEGRMLHDFLAFVKKYPSAPIYHYGSYERTHLVLMGKKYGMDMDFILERMIDILAIVRKSVALPVMSQSLKEVGKFLGFKWRGMADAQESIVLYFQYLETKERELLQRIIDYNEDDVRATKVVKDFLVSLTR